MTHTALALLTMMIFSAGSVYAGGKTCANPRLQWELRASYGDPSVASRILNDGKGAYKDGADGVQAVINACSGSGDATLQTGSQRLVKFDFSAKVSGTRPSWADTNDIVSGSTFLNLRNLRLIDAALEGSFTTWLGSNVPSPRRASHSLRMFNPEADFKADPKIISADQVAATNTPYVTSKVFVYHCPARNPAAVSGPCTGLTKETWFVNPDPAPNTYPDGTSTPYSNVGTLTDVGQFEVPFFFVISIIP